jgi:hypothetical protein
MCIISHSFRFLLIIIAAISLTSNNLRSDTSPQTPASEVTENADSPAVAEFTPPPGWNAADKKFLTAHVRALIIGPKIKSDMPPTMNLMIEPFKGTLREYLKNVKRINESHGDSWKDLGTITTKAGQASLSSVDVRSKWGGEKLMHVIIIRDGYAYVLTAAASKNEFFLLYKQFYTSMQSLQIHDNDMTIPDLKEKSPNN